MTISELALKSSDDEPVRRFEVFTGAGRRRDWSDDDKARIVGESYEPGATVSDVARR
jgi:transposase